MINAYCAVDLPAQKQKVLQLWRMEVERNTSGEKQLKLQKVSMSAIYQVIGFLVFWYSILYLLN